MPIVQLVRRLLVKLGVILTIFGALSTYQSQAVAEVELSAGYYELTASFVPHAVRVAADSVFEIHILNPNSKTTISSVDLEKVEEKISKSLISLQDKQVYLEQMRYCRKMNFKSCDVYDTSGAGTGFLLGDGQTLWTDYHVIESYVKGLATLFKRPESIAFLTLENQNLPVAIFDNNKRMVFFGSKSDGRAEVVAKPYDGHAINFLKGEYRSSSDFIKIRLSRSIGIPLTLAKTVPPEGEAVFALGYPAGTGPFREISDPRIADKLVTRAPYADAKGKQIHVSPGFVLNPHDGLNRTLVYGGEKPISKEEFQSAKFYSHILPSDNPDLTRLVYLQIDVIFGNSGGPLVNNRGEAFAMAGSVAVELNDGKYARTTAIGLNLIEAEIGHINPSGKSKGR